MREIITKIMTDQVKYESSVELGKTNPQAACMMGKVKVSLEER